MKVGRNFRWGTWNECLDCYYNYAAPPSLKTAIPAIIFGACFLSVTAVMLPDAKNDSTIAIFAGTTGFGGLILILGGVRDMTKITETASDANSASAVFARPKFLPTNRPKFFTAAHFP